MYLAMQIILCACSDALSQVVIILVNLREAEGGLRGHKSREHRDQLPPASENPTVHFVQNQDGIQNVEQDESPELNMDINEVDAGSEMNVETEPILPKPSFSSEDVVKKMLHLYLTLNSVHHVPHSILQTILDTYGMLIKMSNTLVESKICDALAKHGVSSDVPVQAIVSQALCSGPLENVQDLKGPVRSAYMRKKQFTNNHQFVKPKSHYLGRDAKNRRRVFHTIPLKKSLQTFFSNDSVSEQLKDNMPEPSRDNYLRDIYDGSAFQKLREESEEHFISLILYSDDLELANPIGCAKTVHKITNIYIAVANLYPWSRFKKTVLTTCPHLP